MSSSAIALELGIAMVQQELNPIPHMTIAENMYLGRYPRRLGVVNMKKLNKMTSDFFRSLDMEFDPERNMFELSISEVQMIEIAKTVLCGSRIVIMDEPTSALTETEAQKLFSIIESLKKKGVAIIYISHKMDELFRIADRVTVLRDGIVAGSNTIDEVNKQSLIKMMVGRELADVFPKGESIPGDERLSVKDITRKGEFEDVSFTLRSGEILGIAGLMGSGRTEIATSIFGERKLDKGFIFIDGKRVSIKNTADAVKHKMALVPEDRKLYGVNLQSSVLDNILMVVQNKLSFAGVVNPRKGADAARSMVESLSIKINSLEQNINTLSGGNQQKVILAKWLLSKPEIVILDDPTRGIDVGAKMEIYKLINELAEKGTAIIFISSEMPEIIGMCDRVLVLHMGILKGELSGDDMTQEKIMTLAAGEEVA